MFSWNSSVRKYLQEMSVVIKKLYTERIQKLPLLYPFTSTLLGVLWVWPLEWFVTLATAKLYQKKLDFMGSVRISRTQDNSRLRLRVSLVAQMVKNLTLMQETWVRSLGWEDPLEKEVATHFHILAWEIPWTEEPSGLHLWSRTRVRHNWETNSLSRYTWEKHGIG